MIFTEFLVEILETVFGRTILNLTQAGPDPNIPVRPTVLLPQIKVPSL